MDDVRSCENCKYNSKSPNEAPCNECVHNAVDKWKPFTNADRIRAMDDEELEMFIRAIRCCSHYGNDCGYPFCHSMRGNLCNGIKSNTDLKLRNWLQSEVEA